MRALRQGKPAHGVRALWLCCALGMSAAGCGRFGFDPGPAVDLSTADAGTAALPDDDASSDAATDAAVASDAAPDGPLDDANVPSLLDDAGLDDAGLEAHRGTWQERALPYASGAAASAVLSDGLHYLGGALDYDGDTTRYQHHYLYEAATETWSAAPADVPDDDTWGARAHVFEDRLYLLGGYPSGRRFRVYHPTNNTWTSLQAPPVDLQWGFASGIIGGVLYAFGGEPGPTANAAGSKYDFAAGTWSAVAPIPVNGGSGSLSSAVVGSRLYVLNGNADDGSTLFQIYDSTTNSWSTGVALSGHLFEGAASSVLGSRIYFLGGAADHNHSDHSSTPAVVSAAVNIYDTVANRWTTGPAMGAPKMWATAQVYNGKLHVLGGLDAASLELADHDVLTP